MKLINFLFEEKYRDVIEVHVRDELLSIVPYTIWYEYKKF
jgi:hypothetical protein